MTCLLLVMYQVQVVVVYDNHIVRELEKRDRRHTMVQKERELSGGMIR